MKYVVVTGGVVSGIGKGITISSIGRLLKASGLSVTAIKIDPYLNVDAGTMSPFEHGETFVLNDGGETDLDLGNYERFLDVTLTARHNITTGKVYNEVIHRERRGDYLGKTVQIVPHATDMVQNWIKEVSKIPVDETGEEPDLCLVEVGGTVGDIESMVFLEALRQFQFTIGTENIMFIHVSLVPALGSAGEQKTKPTQHSVKELRSVGMSPDIIVCRSTQPLDAATRLKISGFCHVSPSNVLAVHDVSNIYHVPLILVEQGIHSLIRKRLCLEATMLEVPNLESWREMANNVDIAAQNAKLAQLLMVDKDSVGVSDLHQPIKIALVGKYTGQQDAYLSVVKSFRHSVIHLGVNVDIDIQWVEASDLEPTIAATAAVTVQDAGRSKRNEGDTASPYERAWSILRDADGICVPGGFGNRGIEGKILACQYARESKKPYLGLCLGMQIMVMEYSRNVLHWSDANSTEFNEDTKNPVIIFMPEVNKNMMGGTMRLGARATLVSPNYEMKQSQMDDALPCVANVTTAALVYGCTVNKDEDDGDTRGVVVERHRHRYEVNPAKVSELETAGLVFSGRDETGERMEIVELPRSVHPYFLGTQFHPEFKSRPNRPSPPFFGFLAVCAGMTDKLGRAGELWQAHESRNLLLLRSPLLSPISRKKRSRSDASEGHAVSLRNAHDDTTSAETSNGLHKVLKIGYN